MDHTQLLIDLIKQHEGFVEHAYKDSEGYLTIGYGRLIDERLGGGISAREAEYLLMNDINQVIETAKKYTFWPNLNEPRKAVIVSMLFNLGQPRFDKFRKTKDAIHAGDYETAANEMLDSMWRKQVGHRAEHLAEMMRTGEWDES